MMTMTQADSSAGRTQAGPGRGDAGDPTRRALAGAARAFTLIELLVVIVIIGILIALTVTVAGKVTEGGKSRVTHDALKVADQALSSYVQTKEAIPAPVFEDPRDPSRKRLIPVADARNMGGPNEAIINSVGLFIHQAESDAGLTGLFSGLDARMFQKHDPDTTDSAYGGATLDQNIDQMAEAPSSFDDQPWIPTLLDGFGRPIRYVHPEFGGVIYGPSRANPSNPATGLAADQQFFLDKWTRGGEMSFSYPTLRRNNEATTGTNPLNEPDSDGGRPVGNRPYFYSAGADGDPSTIEDNVYITKPEFDEQN